MFLVLYANDTLLAKNDTSFMCKAKVFLTKFFRMKDLGVISFILGIKIHRDPSRSILGLLQHCYIKMC